MCRRIKAFFFFFGLFCFETPAGIARAGVFLQGFNGLADIWTDSASF